MTLKSLTYLAAILGSLFGTASMSAQAPKAKPANDLAWKMYRSIGAKGDNVFISPASLATAIGLAFEGSSGETREKARRFLALESLAADAPLVPGVKESFDRPGDSMKLIMNNAVWVDPIGVDPTPEYLKRAEKFYSAKIAKRAFADGMKVSDEINAWVKKSTNGMIERLVGPNDLKDRHVAILNAVYFLGTWQEPFEASRTSEEDFTTSGGRKARLPLMNQSEHFSISESPKYKVLHLPYKNPNYVMSIVLPNRDVKLADLEKTLSAGAFESQGSRQKVWVKLPKFKIEWGMENVIDSLIALGLPRSGPKSDFKMFGAKEDIVLSAVLHKAVVKVDEKGTEAAAATAVMMLAGAMPSKPVEFHCDRPFLFAIRDAKRNEILFIGRFAKP